jgi:PAT family beta-lactamase induction signal transducer AmpG
MQTTQVKNPWLWVPPLYFAQAVPYMIIVVLSTLIYKDLGISNADATLFTSLLYWPWVIKPLWSPVVDMFGTKRRWTILMQVIVALGIGAIAGVLQMPGFFMISLGVMWVIALASATHDIAADGFYMLALPQDGQAAYVGVRSTFYKLAALAMQGPVVIFAGHLIKTLGNPAHAWSIALGIVAAVFALFVLWHQFVLPRPADDHAVKHSNNPFADFIATFGAFFAKRDIWLIVGFILTYRLGESQLLKLALPFLRDPVVKGGLGLSTEQVGFAYGTVGVVALIAGGLAGGYLISRHGLKRCLWPMVLAVHLPDLVFVYLSSAQPANIYLVSAFLAVEQFGYGFGFTAMMLYMIMVADGEHKTAHYALCTGLMALGMMVPGMVSGHIQEFLGYRHFFIWVCLATIPAFIMAALVNIDPAFGKKKP